MERREPWQARILQTEFYPDATLQNFPTREGPQPGASSSIYHPLNAERREIRLIYIKKSHLGGALEARLLHVSLDNTPQYEALSYCWGDKQNPGLLTLDGYHLEITSNLKAALVQLRSETIDRFLWVDAVCINQEDLQERSEQVQFMREIYTKAIRTLIWLGNAEADSDLAMIFLKELEAATSPADFLLSTLENRREDSLYEALEHLFIARPYWQRVWIIQEVICATDVVVHCGGYSVSLATMHCLTEMVGAAWLGLDDYFAMQYHAKFRFNISLHGHAKLRKQLTDGAQTRRPLLELLDQHKSARCTDPRDKIYALIGLSYLDNSDHPGLKIDYTRSISQVYRGAAQAVIEATGELDIICLTSEPCVRPSLNHYTPRQPFLPSWAPDWNVYRDRVSLSAHYLDARASGDERAHFKFFAGGTILLADGICIAPISYCSKTFENTIIRDEDILLCLFHWRLLACQYLGIVSGLKRDNVLDQFYRLTLCEKPYIDTMLPQVRTSWLQWEMTILRQPSINALIVLPYLKEYLQFLSIFCTGRRMFVFESPEGQTPPSFKMGMCPSGARERDLICVLLGCKIPVVLRPQDDYYILIGEALVPEYMKGKVMQERAEGTRRLQSFAIR